MGEAGRGRGAHPLSIHYFLEPKFLFNLFIEQDISGNLTVSLTLTWATTVTNNEFVSFCC